MDSGAIDQHDHGAKQADDNDHGNVPPAREFRSNDNNETQANDSDHRQTDYQWVARRGVKPTQNAVHCAAA